MKIENYEKKSYFYMGLLGNMKFFKKIVLKNKNSRMWEIYVFSYFKQNFQNFMH